MPQDNAPENPTDPTDPLLGSSASHFSIPANQDSPALRDVITQIENTLTSLAPSVSDNQIPDDVVRNTLAFGGFASVSAALQTAKGTSKEKAQLLAVKLVERIVREERLSDASVVVDEVLWVVLTKKWNLGRRETSALEAALQVEATSFLSSDVVRNFIMNIWNDGNQIDPNREKRFSNTDTTLGKLWHNILTYLDRWRTPRYQNVLVIIVALVYIALYFFIVNLSEYKNSWPSVLEWIFYLFVIGETVYELQQIFNHPSAYLTTLSTWFTLPPTILLFTSFVLRIVALNCTSRLQMIRHLYTSYILLCFVAPFLFLRLIIWLDAFETIAKIEILLGRSLRDSFWVFVIFVVTVIGYWQAVFAIEEDENLWTVLKVLVMGALSAPDFDATTRYDPIPNTLLFFTYLFLITIVITSLLVASFIASYLSLYASIHQLYLLSFTAKTVASLHSGDDTGLIFPPFGNLAELIFLKPIRLAATRSANHYPLDSVRRNRWTKVYNNIREVVWVIFYLPVILLVLVAELTYTGFNIFAVRLSNLIYGRRQYLGTDNEPAFATARDTRDLASMRGNPAASSTSSFHHPSLTNNYYYYNTSGGPAPQLQTESLRKILDVLERLEERTDAIEKRLGGLERRLAPSVAQSELDDEEVGTFEVENVELDDN